MEIKSDTILYAVWEKVYSIRYDMNGEKGTSSTTTCTDMAPMQKSS